MSAPAPVYPALDPETDEILWRAHEGPQTRFLAAQEFELLYGGAAGGGKSEGLLILAVEQYTKRGYRALLLREAYTELGELIDRSKDIYEPLGGTYNAQEHKWTFSHHDALGAYETYVHFGYFEKWKDRRRYRGWQFSFIGWDELGECPEERFWLFLMSRCRSGGPGIQPMMRGTANPGGAGHGWLKRRFIIPCGADGAVVVREPFTYTRQGPTGPVKVTVVLSRRFIPSRVTDNPTVMENNPLYVAQLYNLPETMRRQMLLGDWNAGEGLAFEEVSAASHLVKPFVVPPHWPVFGSFDWGYTHPWAWGFWTVNEDGRLYLVDTVHGRRLKDQEIAERILANLPAGVTKERLLPSAAGHDCWSEIKARSETGITTAETFLRMGLVLKQANLSRSDGFKHLLELLAWRGQDRDEAGRVVGDGEPRLVAMDTPGNRATLAVLETMVTEPDHPGDVLKVDADPITGLGGDDPYDMVRYGAMERPAPAPTAYKVLPIRAFDKAVLKAEMERNRRGLPTPPRWAASEETDLTTYLGGF